MSQYTSLQPIFDRVVTHLLTQNARSVSSDDADFCLYRGPNGLKCAVGCLIPDEVYTPAMENLPPFRLLRDFPQAIPCVSADDKTATALLGQLQTIHDSYIPSEWPHKLSFLARVFGLTMPQAPTEGD